jgi:hypothetical protein
MTEMSAPREQQPSRDETVLFHSLLGLSPL